MEDNVCTFCKQDKGESGISAVTECLKHFVSTDQCECPTVQAIRVRPEDCILYIDWLEL